MAADVVFTEESPWYTSSRSWKAITEYAVSRPGGRSQDDCRSHLDALGVDFTVMPDDTAAEVAAWLAEVIERMIAGGEIGQSDAGRAHARELVRKLRSEIQARDHRKVTPLAGLFCPGDGIMSETSVSGRQAGLLAVVAEGGGDWDARRIDLTVSVRYGPGPGTVLRELEELRRLGLVVRDDSRSGVGGRWTVTAAARPYLEEHDDIPRPREDDLG